MWDTEHRYGCLSRARFCIKTTWHVNHLRASRCHLCLWQFIDLSEEGLHARVAQHTSMMWVIILNTAMEASDASDASEARSGCEEGRRVPNSKDIGAQDDPVGSSHLSGAPASRAHRGSRPPLYPALLQYVDDHWDEIEQIKKARRRYTALFRA